MPTLIAIVRRRSGFSVVPTSAQAGAARQATSSVVHDRVAVAHPLGHAEGEIPGRDGRQVALLELGPVACRRGIRSPGRRGAPTRGAIESAVVFVERKRGRTIVFCLCSTWEFRRELKNPKYLYHGSSTRIVGSTLVPTRPFSLGKGTERLTAVYATDVRDAAIIMGMISECRSSLHFCENGAEGLVYEGWPRREEIYLYILPSRSFRRIDDWQWCSKEPVGVIRVEKLKTHDHLYLIRKATEEERRKFSEGHKRRCRSIVCHAPAQRLRRSRPTSRWSRGTRMREELTRGGES